MGIDMADTVREVAGIARREAKRVEVVNARDKVFFVDHESGGLVEVEPRREDDAPHLPSANLIKLRSVIDWAASFPEGTPGEVHLSRSGTTDACSPRFARAHEKRERVSKGFFDEFMPSGQWTDLDGFMSWLDKVRPGMTEDEREVVDAAFSAVSATSARVVEVSVNGAVIQAEVTQGDKVTGKRPLPRNISSTVPIGDPAFRYRCRFIISARVQGGSIAFRAVRDPNDGSVDAWVEWAEKALRDDLPDGWLVLVTP